MPGCAARRQAIIDGVVKALELFQKRSDEHDKLVKQGGRPDAAKDAVKENKEVSNG